ncbi:MAG: peptidoglycan DD-metalloendopeptidase family protein [Desulfobacterales bacterium]|nr:peptidoglycan DD-metalloendopeptidase family protein [Desulfobacterales bacterium]
MSYLDDDAVILSRGCYDETGAHRYNRDANVPDNYVVALQRDLQTMGFSPGLADGAFGNRTTDALKDFQKAARNTQRLRNSVMIAVEPVYTGDDHGECDLTTRREIKLWLDSDYRAPWPVPPPLTEPEKPLQYKDVRGRDVPFASPEGKFWPIRTRDRGREIAYQGESGKIYGQSGRRFLASRYGGRYHAGVDLWGKAGDLIVACEDGQIVNYYWFYDNVDCLFVQCDSGVVINYGEVKPNSWQLFDLKKGLHVKAGQPIAVVGQMTQCSMCHFETYAEGTVHNYRWYMGKPVPKQLLDPTRYLLHLAAEGEPMPLVFSEPDVPSVPEPDFSLVNFSRLPNFSGLERKGKQMPKIKNIKGRARTALQRKELTC